MSGNPQLDMQIAQAVQPQFNPMQAIQQMQRPAVQPVQNPIFGGNVPIPMNFALPAVNQIPANYQPPQRQFQPGMAGGLAELRQQISDLSGQMGNQGGNRYADTGGNQGGF